MEGAVGERRARCERRARSLASAGERPVRTMDASFFADIFVRIAALSRRWEAEQAKSERLFTALLTFHDRLHLLSVGEPLSEVSAMKGQEDLVPLLRGKHMRGLENILTALRKSANTFESLRAEISEVHAAVWQRHGAMVSAAETKPRKSSAATSGGGDATAMLLAEPAWGVVGAGRGRDARPVGLPAPMVCIEWVRELDAMYASELLLKLSLIDSIDLGAKGEVMQGTQRLWSLQPHLTPAAIERVAALAESLTLAESAG